MGACCSNTDSNTQAINDKLHQLERQEKKLHKLLFLGAGGSGKSTIFKQLQWLHGGGFNHEDAMQLKHAIYVQIIAQTKVLITYYKLTDNDINDTILQEAIDTVLQTKEYSSLHNELSDAIEYLWKNEENIQNAFNDEELSKQQLLAETTQYFWNKLDEIKDPNYVPNETDIINVRFRTTGIHEKIFKIREGQFYIADVGGQKSERKKWVNCFSEVEAVVFVVSLSCYNELMYEDQTKNAMDDSMTLFEETINNKHFKDKHIVLFLNKKDLFKKKIKKFKITDCPVFDDFDGWNVNKNDPNSYPDTTDYIKHKFLALDMSISRTIHTHLTYAMDKQNVDNVFTDVAEIVIGRVISDAGF